MSIDLQPILVTSPKNANSPREESPSSPKSVRFANNVQTFELEFEPPSTQQKIRNECRLALERVAERKKQLAKKLRGAPQATRRMISGSPKTPNPEDGYPYLDSSLAEESCSVSTTDEIMPEQLFFNRFSMIEMEDAMEV